MTRYSIVAVLVAFASGVFVATATGAWLVFWRSGATREPQAVTAFRDAEPDFV